MLYARGVTFFKFSGGINTSVPATAAACEVRIDQVIAEVILIGIFDHYASTPTYAA